MARARCPPASGSADVLTALGVDVTADADRQRLALARANICFMFAPAHHGAMRYVMPVREDLGFRTVFNFLGPLSNPAGAKRQVLGVFDIRWVEPLARVLGALGSTRAWVVHGGGLDELTTTGPSEIAEWRDGGVRLFKITPEAVGLARAAPADLRGGDPEYNAARLRAVLRRRDRRLPRYRPVERRRRPAGGRAGGKPCGKVSPLPHRPSMAGAGCRR